MGRRRDRPRLFLGQIAFVKSNIELILVGVVALSILRIAIGLLRNSHRSRKNVPIEPERPKITMTRQ